MDEGRSVQIPLAIAGCVLLWTVAVMLLVWDSWVVGVGVVGRWGLLFSAGAAATTVLVALRTTRRRFVDTIEARVRKALQEEQIASLDVARRG